MKWVFYIDVMEDIEVPDDFTEEQVKRAAMDHVAKELDYMMAWPAVTLDEAKKW